MGDLKACRVCLATDVKMYSLRGYPLEAYFEPIVGLNPLYVADLPLYACYECAALIKKYYFFREKCLKGQTVLYTLLQKHGQITLDYIKELDREKLNLSSHCVQFLLNKDELQCVDSEAAANVKQETGNENLAILENFLPLSEPHNIEFDVDVDVQVKLLKTEDDYTDLPSLGPDSTDDDEPLATHKSLKDRSAKKDKKKKLKKDNKKKKKEATSKLEELDISQEIFNEMNGEVELPILPIEETEPEVKKAKRGRPRKSEAKTEEPKAKTRRTTNTGGVAADEADLEDYVNVIKLSVAEQIEEITKRQESSNYLNAPYQCSLCYKGFIDTHAWKHHVGKHGPSAGDVECPICKFRFKTRRALQKHAANHEKKYACKSCPYVSKTTTQAKQHHRWHKGVTYKCQYCDEVSTKWTSYLSHVRIKHPSEFICGICGYSFVSKLGLTMHRSMMHKDVIAQQEALGADSPRGPYCELCAVQFISVEAWKRHMVTSAKHTQTTHFNNGCRVCGESFKSPEELRVHHRKEHARKRPKNYGKKPSIMTWPAKCEHCDEEIPNAREYWTHFRRVHPDKKYPIQKSYICEICGKSFRGNAFLVYHKRTHFEERAYKCNQCPKAFFNRTNLQMHEKTHSDNRPYPCTVCFKAFKCKGALDRHFRSHTGVKPYSCEFCGKSFGQSNSRKLHVRTVHLRQPAPYVSRARQERRRT